MFNGEHKRPFIEKMYLMNEKNFERTLDQFLTGNIPKDNELQIITTDAKKKVDENSKEEDDIEIIDTSTKVHINN
jgi:hypothetical protein